MRSPALILLCLLIPDLSAADPSLTVVTEWGSHGSAPGTFGEVTALAIGANHEVFVADRPYHRVQYFTPDGVLLGTWHTQRRIGPIDVAADEAGYIYALYDSGRVDKFTAAGTLVGALQDTGSIGSQAVVIDADGQLVICSYRGRVRTIDQSGQLIRQFDSIEANALTIAESGDIYVGTFVPPMLARYTVIGTLLGQSSGGTCPVVNVGDIVSDGRGGIFTTDTSANLVYLWSASLDCLWSWRLPSIGQPIAPGPRPLAFDPDGFLYVGDWWNGRIVKYRYESEVPVRASTWGQLKATYR